MVGARPPQGTNPHLENVIWSCMPSLEQIGIAVPILAIHNLECNWNPAEKLQFLISQKLLGLFCPAFYPFKCTGVIIYSPSLDRFGAAVPVSVKSK